MRRKPTVIVTKSYKTELALAMKKLEAVADILSTDAAAESDFVHMDEHEKRPVTDRESQLAWVVTEIYKIVHPLFCGSCKVRKEI